MSLSQKHSGKILVPWFNVAEWKSVYNLIYGGSVENWPKALEILHVWKLRTPLLSAGVEGTLILLEALLLDKIKLTSYEITHILSTSLVRFLNLCAANSDKQGTFYKTAMKNGLPNWLIGVRHDIAHGHILPSQSMLELSLKFCLDWLRGKYWNIQHEYMSDLIANKADISLIEDAIYIHICFANKGEENLENNEEFIERVHKFIRNGNKQKLINKKVILSHVNTYLKEIIENNSQEAIDKICELLINNYAILTIDCEFETSGAKKIPGTSLKKWSNLLNLIYETGLMENFVCKLFNFICGNGHNFIYQEIASLWIKEIFQGLKHQDSNDKDVLKFSSKNNCMKNKDFASEVLEKVTPFTVNFVRQILEYNNASEEFIEDSVNLIIAFTSSKIIEDEKIYTAGDLNLNSADELMNVPNVEDPQPTSRWTLIEDISPFKNLPLGILPHQSRSLNPLTGL